MTDWIPLLGTETSTVRIFKSHDGDTVVSYSELEFLKSGDRYLVRVNTNSTGSKYQHIEGIKNLEFKVEAVSLYQTGTTGNKLTFSTEEPVTITGVGQSGIVKVLETGLNNSFTVQSNHSIHNTRGYWVKVYYREYFPNNSPTITDATSDGQTLYENDTITLTGTASDTDSGNVVDVKYKINSGTEYIITSQTSDGVTPISYSKDLTISNNSIKDGDIVITSGLSYDTPYTVTITAYDDQGATSSSIIRTFILRNSPPNIIITSQANQTLGLGGTKAILKGKVWDADADVVTVSASLDGVTKSVQVNAPTTEPLEDNWTLEWDITTDNIEDGGYSEILVTANDGHDTSTDIYKGIILIGTKPVIYVTQKDYPQIVFGVLNPFGETLHRLEVELNGMRKVEYLTDITQQRIYNILEEDLTQEDNTLKLILTYGSPSTTYTRIFKINNVETIKNLTATKQLTIVKPLKLADNQALSIKAFLNDLHLEKETNPIEENKAKSLFMGVSEEPLWNPTLKFEIQRPRYYESEIKRMLGVID